MVCAAQDSGQASHASAGPHTAVVSAAPTRCRGGPASRTDVEATGALWVLRDNRKYPGALPLRARSAAHLAQVARPPVAKGEHAVGEIQPTACSLPATPATGCTHGLTRHGPPSESLTLKSRVQQSCTPGSAGAPGEKSPGATRAAPRPPIPKQTPNRPKVVTTTTPGMRRAAWQRSATRWPNPTAFSSRHLRPSGFAGTGWTGSSMRSREADASVCCFPRRPLRLL
jgi:hypothetical protein